MEGRNSLEIMTNSLKIYLYPADNVIESVLFSSLPGIFGNNWILYFSLLRIIIFLLLDYSPRQRLFT